MKSSSEIVPRWSTSLKSNSSDSAHSRTACPSAAVRNSPFSFSSLRAFHCLGLCEAVSMSPPSALEKRTAISVVGVDANPARMTSTPHATSVPQTTFSTISPESLASFPTTTVYLSPAPFGLRSRSLVQYAYTNLTISTGVSASPGFPPMVPRIPEMDFISDIISMFWFILRYICLCPFV